MIPRRLSLFSLLSIWLIGKITSREPDVIIGGKDRPYLRRWWVWPRNRICNLYLHQFVRSDDDRALHDHPWINASIVLTEGYVEVMPRDPYLLRKDPASIIGRLLIRRDRRPGSVTFRRATASHRVELHKDANGNEIPVWSLFFTGRLKRTWGFWCPKGWRKWTLFVENETNSEGQIVSKVGRGCGD